ncbi:MAG TPA: lipocalin family protein, partial [Pyrinomonadaceae bacterium]|nr:lipocalin family protein [Pyrinomonadaceae bacterium]
ERRGRAAAADVSVVKFTPGGDSGVAKALADALGGDAQERAALAEAFAQLKQGYEAEVAKEGKSNNLAAAFAFFIASNVAAYRQSEMPSDRATELLFGELQAVIAGAPEFSRMSNAEKQRMHDWLVMMGGFTLAGYSDARQTGDAASLNTYRELADSLLRLVLGVEAGKLSFRGEEFLVEQERPAPAQASAGAGAKVVGVWSKSASSPWGTSPGAVATNAGYYKGQYQFRADGSYSFKGESWGGYSRSDEFWTVEETGTYALDGNSLTVSPAKSTATLRDRAGVVKQSKNNTLEKMTYGWSLHFFEGIGETNLVLRPARQTMRDGGFSGNSDFPNSYLYTQNGNLEWRF